MVSTKVLSTRVTMDSYVQVLEWAKCQNLKPSDYIISAIYGYEKYNRDTDKTLSGILGVLGLDSSKMTIDEKMETLEAEINKQKQEVERVKKITIKGFKKAKTPKVQADKMPNKTLDERLSLEIQKLEMELAKPEEITGEPLVKPPLKTKKAESKLKFVNFSKH
jgi:hypothetical protein